MPSAEKLAGFVAWCRQRLAGDEKGEGQVLLDHFFPAFGWAGGLKEAAATPAGSYVLFGGLASAIVSNP